MIFQQIFSKVIVANKFDKKVIDDDDLLLSEIKDMVFKYYFDFERVGRPVESIILSNLQTHDLKGKENLDTNIYNGGNLLCVGILGGDDDYGEINFYDNTTAYYFNQDKFKGQAQTQVGNIMIISSQVPISIIANKDNDDSKTLEVFTCNFT